MRERMVVLFLGLVVALLLMVPGPAVAGCYCDPTVHNTGTLTGTGSDCSAATTDLKTILNNAALAKCQSINDNTIGLCNYTESLHACMAGVSGKMRSGSAGYQCQVCFFPPVGN